MAIIHTVLEKTPDGQKWQAQFYFASAEDQKEFADRWKLLVGEDFPESCITVSDYSTRTPFDYVAQQIHESPNCAGCMVMSRADFNSDEWR